MAQLDVEPGQRAMLAGGPPCQGFSKNVPRKFRCLNDTNNLRVHTFLGYCERLEPRSYDQRSFVTVWDAIGDLPSLDHGEGTDPCEYACGPFSDYQQIMHAPPECGTT